MNIYNDLRDGDVSDWSDAVKRLCKPQEYALTVMTRSTNQKYYQQEHL